jgi:hypothetical protein
VGARGFTLIFGLSAIRHFTTRRLTEVGLLAPHGILRRSAEPAIVRDA